MKNKQINKKKTIVICASVSFYKQVIDVKKELKKLGFNVVVPKLATIMEKSGNFDFEFHKPSYFGGDVVKGKAIAIKKHFKKIEKGDVLLVVNSKKHGIEGYIGPNVLMEMGLAFYLGIPIFVLNPIPANSPFIEELNAMKPIVLSGKLENIIL